MNNKAKCLLKYWPKLVTFLAFFLSSSLFAKEELQLAVSTSIHGPVARLCEKFSHDTGFGCKLTSAPAGHLYAHVMHGMAYDVVIFSDENYTQALVNAQKVEPQNRWIVATGRIVLWSADPAATSESLRRALLNQSDHQAIVIANPGVSPYGGAAREVLQGYHLWNHIQGRLVYGKDLQQSLEMVASRKVPLGFVPLAKLSAHARERKRYWEPDPTTYKPVIYEAITLKISPHQGAAAAFMHFLHGKEACQILQRAGFNCPTSPVAA